MTTRSEQLIHPTAVIDRTAEVDPSTRIGPYSVIGAGVRIGPGCVLHNHVSVHGPTSIGAGNVIYPYAVLGAEPQDLKYRGSDTTLEIGNGNRIREHATIHRGTEHGGGKTVIGDDCLLMVGAHVAHDCVIEDQVVIANGAMLGGHCLVEFGCTIAGGAGVHHFATVGRLSFIGGMARITKDVPPYLVVEGNPAEARKVNTTALIRRGWSLEDVEAMRSAFKKLFRNQEAPVRETIDQLRRDPDQPEAVIKLCDFIERTTMGVHGRYLESTREGEASRYNRR